MVIFHMESNKFSLKLSLQQNAVALLPREKTLLAPNDANEVASPFTRRKTAYL